MNNWIFFALISLIVYVPSFIATGVSTRDKSQYDDTRDKYPRYRQGSDTDENEKYKPSTSDYNLKDLIQKIYGSGKGNGDYKDKYPKYGSDDDGKNKYGSDKKGDYRDYNNYKDGYSRYGSDKRGGSDDRDKDGGNQTDGYSKYGSNYDLNEILQKLKRLNKDNYDYGYDGYDRYGQYDNDRSRYSNGGKRGSRSSSSSRSGSGSGGRRGRRRGSKSGSGSSSASGSRRDRSRNGGYKGGYYGDDRKDTKDRMNSLQRDASYNDDKTRHDQSHQWSARADRNGDDSGSDSRSRSRSRSAGGRRGRGSRSGSGSDSGSGSRSRRDRDRGDGSDGKDRNGGSDKGKACCDRRQVEKMEDSGGCREGCECCPDGTYVASIGDGKRFKCGDNYLIKGKDRMGEICRADYKRYRY